MDSPRQARSQNGATGVPLVPPHLYPARVAAALLALTAACGSGRPAPVSKFGVRMQNPAELDTENGLIAVGLSDACLGLDAASMPPAGTDTLTDPALTDPTLVDPNACG